MGNRRSREFRQQQAHDASWAQLHAEPWRPSDPRRADGSGIPRLQIVRLPTFSPPSFWEVCDLKSEWRLYSATVVDSSCYSLTVRGYELVQFDGHKLKEFFERIVSISMPVRPYLNNVMGRDGIVTQLTLFGDLCSQARYQWWSNAPPQWKPLVDITNEMLAAFGGDVNESSG